MKKLLKGLALVLTTGCVSTAGPFVTNISPAPEDGAITVEKCMTKYSQWTNSIKMEDCNTQVIRVMQLPPKEENDSTQGGARQ